MKEGTTSPAVANAMAEKRTITLCGVQGCCPTVEFDERGDATIKDDFGSQVKLTKDQMKSLIDQMT